MATDKTGGPAFPVPILAEDQAAEMAAARGVCGMTLRDAAALAAMSPMLVQAYGTTPAILAKKAYDIGEAFVAEKGRREREAAPDPHTRID